ncbi:MAG: BREX-2 system adenine-specific DNA-methyltransferase PglX, partial [Sandaracinaceae bacterium]|nr:BREX-2 system adenine-specific DNA-methyltransferase PglX [Sandaracinaceae bacterium]
PRFVEAFILERTLEPAIERFGLDEVTVFDPTCGSGHFRLGAYARLSDHRWRREPARDARELAELALAQVYGADLNPYAVAVARFRLILAYLEEAKIRRLAEAPALALNLVVADSLLNDVKKRPLTLEQQLGVESGVLFRERDPLRLDDPELAARVFGKGHAAVVGNPPYITEKDEARREKYRAMFDSAFRSFSLGVPFTEAFFDYARPGGFIGMITANSFMKREFGKKLIENVLPKLNLTAIVNTQGAYIPGHGTPTVLLFGTADSPKGDEVLTVLASRGEPSTPADPAQGEVWRSIAEHTDEVGFENDYITVKRTPRAELKVHPWSLGGGGATELKALLEERAEKRLSDLIAVVGFGAVTREDDLFLLGDEATLTRWGIPAEHRRRLVAGEDLRDWSSAQSPNAIFPYDPDSLDPTTDSAIMQALWPWRTGLARRVAYGQTQIERGLPWFAYSMFFSDRFRTPLSIAFAEVATHNHFVLDRGGKVFKQTAPIIKLPEDATEDDHLALLAYLNSSTACFWMKQVCFDKGNRGEGGGFTAELWEKFYQYSSSAISEMPIPPLDDAQRSRATEYGRTLSELGARRSQLSDVSLLFGSEKTQQELERQLADQLGRLSAVENQLRAQQESLDWWVYSLFGLAEQRGIPTARELPPGERLSDRLFAKAVCEGAIGERYFTLCRLPSPDILTSFPHEPGALEAVVEGSTFLRLLENPVYKRTFREGMRPPDVAQIASTWLACEAEAAFDETSTLSPTHVVQRSGSKSQVVSETCLHRSLRDSLVDILSGDSVPFLAAYRYTGAGLTKHGLWQETWALQRREDAGEKIGPIDPPPKYDQKDFRKPDYWRLRGKLDVPKERFISYPGCEPDEDGEPVYGWAGWDHLQRAKALWQLYSNRKTQEGWPKERLAPLLAGLLELLPWLLQWHDAPNEDGFRMGQEFDALLTAECHDLGLTREDLSAWRPPETSTKRGRKKKGAS